MSMIFENFSTGIILLHVLGAIIWVGGMIVIRFGVHYAIQGIEDPAVRLGRTLELLRRFFWMVIPSILILVVTAVIMAVGLNLKDSPLYPLVHLKEMVWGVMALLFLVIYTKRNKAQRLFDSGDLAGAKMMLAPLAQWMIPMNIVLGLFALYLGIQLRGL